jgi:uncharacterized protein YkwD
VSSPWRRASRLATALGLAGLGLAVVGLGSGPASTFDDQWIDTTDRDEVVAAYRAEFGAEIPLIGWEGGEEPCDAGSSSGSFRAATLARVNYYRAMAGVVAEVTEEVAFSAKAQRAAMMMSAEGELTHSPPGTFACFTADGEEAAANSNLYLGRTGPLAVDGYIEDPGDANTDVGHRNTILHPPTRKMGVGDVSGSDGAQPANALWVFDGSVFDEGSAVRQPPMREPDRFVAWPPRGYVPAELVHPRWSFTMGGADFSQARVAMYRPWAEPGSREVPLVVVDRVGAPGHVPLPTIVWEPEIATDPSTDALYLVIVSGVTPQSPASPVRVGDAGRAELAGRMEAAFAYEVRVIGSRPGPELTAAELLGRIGADRAP